MTTTNKPDAGFAPTGYMAQACRIPIGKQAHLEPHRVDGHLVGHDVRDVVVTKVVDADSAHVSVYWDGISSPRDGDQSHVHGVTVFRRFQRVLVLSSPRGQAA